MVTASARPGRGFLLGKFMPPHKGHVFLGDFARNYVEELTILCCSLPDDVIPGAKRFAWMSELFPKCRVLSCCERLPQKPEDEPDHFWDIWRDVVARYHPEAIDFVFASETYGIRLAAECNARFVPCDAARIARPCSSTAVRADPFALWQYIPDVVRPYYTMRVCTFGPESSGKTTLATALARHFDTILVPEYGRTYTDAFGTSVAAEDMRRIVDGHVASVKAAARQANRLVVEDTDPLLTAVWSDMLLGRRDSFLEFEDYADHYFLCDVDFPWEDDGTRYFADQEQRTRFFNKCRSELEDRHLPFTLVSGSPDVRLAKAISIVDALIVRGPRSGARTAFR
jgi:HTH-type transcriptional regulator, transcriptional repressor of NAD biosynthesis genes